MRIVTGSICHESSTFTTVETTWDSYRNQRFGYLRGQQVLDKFGTANMAVGGFLSGCNKHGFELIPTIFANAQPSGPTPRLIFDEILNEMLERMAAAGAVDGVLLDLHGSMVAEGIDDGEGHILEAVRRLFGPHIPIIAQLDIHSNMSPQMIEMADVIIGHETYPEIDQEERGKECVDVMQRILCEGLKPTMALHQIPMVWGMNQITAHPPMRQAIELLHEIEARPGVVCGSIATCFPLADNPYLGASTYIVTDNDQDLAGRYADELAAWIWQRRAQWQCPMPATRDVLAEAQAAGRYPIIFADRNDNTGGGSPGDSTGMLRTFIEAGLEDACILYIVDSEAVALCQEAGVGAELVLDVGAKSTPMQGEPVRMKARVQTLGDGKFRYEGPRNRGLESTMGPSAHIVQDGVHVLLVSNREQPFGIAFSLTMGLDPRQMKYIGIKSSAHFRAGFESWAGNIYVVSEPSVHSHETVAGRFKNVGRKLYPFDDI
jgi:microcystin degradation protein MlrC